MRLGTRLPLAMHHVDRSRKQSPLGEFWTVPLPVDTITAFPHPVLPSPASAECAIVHLPRCGQFLHNCIHTEMCASGDDQCTTSPRPVCSPVNSALFAAIELDTLPSPSPPPASARPIGDDSGTFTLSAWQVDPSTLFPQSRKAQP